MHVQVDHLPRLMHDVKSKSFPKDHMPRPSYINAADTESTSPALDLEANHAHLPNFLSIVALIIFAVSS